MKTLSAKSKILEVEWKSTSVYGNPSYWVYFMVDGNFEKGYTATDSSVAYGIRNFENQDCILYYHITKKGSLIIDRIKSIE